MDLLACPLDKSWPLELEIHEEEETGKIRLPIENKYTKVICNYYCNFKKFLLVEISENGDEKIKNQKEIEKNVTLKDCDKCFQIEIQRGTLYCSKEKTHVYDIKEGIPIMLSQDQIEEIYGKK